MSVIEKCSCESNCYRFSHQVAYLERNPKNYPKITEKVDYVYGIQSMHVIEIHTAGD